MSLQIVSLSQQARESVRHAVEAAAADWQAVVGYRRAMTYVLQLARDEHFQYSPQLIRSLHYMMCEHELEASPGLWRPGSIWIRNEASGDVVYEGPDAEQVPGLIDELVSQLARDGATHALVRGAMAHLNLVMIHPFRDGNGRSSRCLQMLVLARERILEPEFCSIEEYLGANTASYYQVLAQVGRGLVSRCWRSTRRRAARGPRSTPTRCSSSAGRMGSAPSRLARRAGLSTRAIRKPG
jgi:Fic family protein